MASVGSTHSYGNPITICEFVDNGTLEINGRCLEILLLHPEVKNRKVVVVSIVGAFRQGKSFFLDYCLRYLYANVSEIIRLCFDEYHSNLTILLVQVGEVSQQSTQQQMQLDWWRKRTVKWIYMAIRTRPCY